MRIKLKQNGRFNLGAMIIIMNYLKRAAKQKLIFKSPL